jgi:hypothetical protein
MKWPTYAVPLRSRRVITGIALFCAALAAGSFALTATVEDHALKANLLILGVGLALVSAALPALQENHRRRKSDKLGMFLIRALDLDRALADPSVDSRDSSKQSDQLSGEMDAYVRKQFGSGAVAHLNNSAGITIIAPRYRETPDWMAREPLMAWCRYRAARLSELIAGLHH